MSSPSNECTHYASKLGDLLARLPVASSIQSWQEIESTARALANALRIRDDPADPHTTLGKTLLPQTLTSLLKDALDGSAIPDATRTTAVYEILRVAANVCMDHDENRGHLLEAGFPQAIVSLLEGYAELIPAELQPAPLALTIPNLQVVKTAIGVLLNASVGYEPVKVRLISLEAAVTLMRLSAAIYPPGSWVTFTPQNAVVAQSGSENTEATISESWNLRSGLSNWAWRTISELKDDSRQIFGPDVLPALIPSLLAFIPPYHDPAPSTIFSQPSQTRSSLLQADFDILEESCMLLESLSLDVEDVRLSFARGFHFPAEHGGVPCLSVMLDFIEKGSYPPLWYTSSGFGEAELGRKEKSFNICKAAVIKAVVEVAGEERNEEVLWDESEEEKPGGDFVCRMVGWLRSYVKDGQDKKVNGIMGERSVDAGRDDLVICATLSLGNLARRENHSTVLLSSPYNLAPLLSSSALLSIATDIKIKHGVVGLLKHIAQSSAQSPANRIALGDAGIVQRLSDSGVWDERSDVMAEVVQIGAIGVVKHMCNGNVENTFALVLASSDAPSAGLTQILALVQRSDNVAIKSEGTRVLVNAVKSLWSNSSTFDGGAAQEAQVTQQKRQVAMAAVLTPASVQSLVRLIGRSLKYPVLINEGVVALSLLSTNTEGSALIATALLSPLPVETSSAASASTNSEVGSPVVTSPTMRSRLPNTRSAFDMLVSILKNDQTITSTSNPRPLTFPVEVRANVCVLIGQVGKKSSGDGVDKIKHSARGILEEISKVSHDQGREAILAAAAKKALDAWA